MTLAQTKWIRNIHVAKTKLNLDTESYRAILLGSAGVVSASELKTWQQYEDVMTAFKKLGFKLTNHTLKKSVETQRGRDPEMITARQEYYIKGLWALASQKKDERSLRAMIKRIAGVDDISFLKKRDATKVILALRTISDTAGFNPDNSGGGDAPHGA